MIAIDDTSSLVALLQGDAGARRASALRAGRRVKVADTLIAQSCLDSETALITRDRDFRLFAEVGGLQLATAP